MFWNKKGHVRKTICYEKTSLRIPGKYRLVWDNGADYRVYDISLDYKIHFHIAELKLKELGFILCNERFYDDGIPCLCFNDLSCLPKLNDWLNELEIINKLSEVE